MELFNVDFRSLLLASLVTGVFGQYTVPSVLAGSSWWDSDKGLIQFGQTDLTGWETEHSGGQLITGWDCSYSETNGNDLFLIFRSQVVYTASQLRAYLCLEITKISEYSYRYFLASAENPDFNYERIKQINDSAAIVFIKSQLCLLSNDSSYPNVKEFHVIVQDGHENDAAQDCTVFGIYDSYYYYISDAQNNAVYCNTTTERWDVCNKTMTFDYSICPQKIAYSDSGKVTCIFNIRVAANYLQSVLTKDEATGELVFTCFTMRVFSNIILMSQAPNSCVKNQAAGNQPVLANSTVVGLNLRLYKHVANVSVSCDEPTSAKNEGPTATLNTEILFGSIGLFLGLPGIIRRTVYTLAIQLYLLL